jgi:hypothetical protein
MTTKSISHLIIATALAGSVAAGLQVTASLASAPVSSLDLPLKAGSAPSGGALFFLLPPAANRFTASPGGLKLAPPPILRLTP